jgi:L-ribulose-5-phosphate 4-epimerase
MLEDLKALVCEQNKRLKREGLVILTEGNVSQISPDRTCFVIKPSGVEYDALTPEDMVVVNLKGEVLDGARKPSSDTPTHIEIYKKFPSVGGITHTHSPHATAFAQMRAPIPCYGTTHADAFWGDIPVTRRLSEKEIVEGYEFYTAQSIGEVLHNTFSPCVLVADHGPFCFGETAKESVDRACILEKVAMMALLGAPKESLPGLIARKHFNRKHGEDRYYGQ